MITINSSQVVGPMKPMHATNNGPATGPAYTGPHRANSDRNNFETFSALRIPYARNHDVALSESYGSQHLVDIHCIFPDFSRDVDDETAYDFVLTDVYTQNIMAAGSQVFYRLGAGIEHWNKKYGTIVPSDFKKWAQICEHVIMHYNQGWANGFQYGMEYWEIWNEADLDPDDAANKKTWSGTKAQFFDFYEIVAKHLKGRFPELKIGGPALAKREDWADDFLREMHQRNVPIDFFSWHIYTADPKAISAKAGRIQKMMEEHGYGQAENILNEWNYVRDWSHAIEYVRAIKGIKGAAFAAAVMCEGQNSPDLDMLMYYDARINMIWNGLFSSDTLEPLKGYYSFKMFSTLYQMENQTLSVCEIPDVYVISAAKDETKAAMIVYYTMDENAVPKVLPIHSDFRGTVACHLLDGSTDGEKVLEYFGGDFTLTMAPNTVVFLTGK